MRKRTLVTLLGLTLVAACSKPSADRGRGAGGGKTSSSAASNVSSLDACALLSPAEIQQILGVAMKAGVKQTTETSSQCQWDSKDESEAVGVSVSVATYDDQLFRTMSSANAAKPVSGYGEAAFKDYPHTGDIAIKHDGHEVDIGVVDFKLSTPKIDDAAATLAKLVLSRL
jgi:hypothetical protein